VTARWRAVGCFHLAYLKENVMKAPYPMAVAIWLTLALVPACFAQDAENKQAADTEASPPTDATSEPISEQQYTRDVQTLLRAAKLDEASQKFQEGLAAYPDSQVLPRLHLLFYSALSRANRAEEAYRHLEQSVDHAMKAAATTPQRTESFSGQLRMLADAAIAKGGKDQALQVLDSLRERADQLPGDADEVHAAISGQRAIVLAKAGDVEAARSLYEEQRQVAQAALQASPDDANAIDRMALVLKNRILLEGAIDGGDEPAAWTALLDFLNEQAHAHADDDAVVRRFAAEHIQRASALARTAPDEAEALLERVTSLPDKEDAGAEIPAIYTSQIARLEKVIETSRRLLALIGSPAAYPENVDGWANGGPFSHGDLQGKVVLLDFFAVWCGPCIATFPHLRQWHDDYGSQGLQIVGISRYYKYGWDDEAKRAKREGEIEPEDERAAMEQFLAHHELRHPVAFVTDATLQEHYGVSGIPHAVIIDRQGVVRMFRIGSGEQNAHDLEEMIKQCLAE
jgi:thiol-disulfide isomerase/thioredoxin